jgi:hypothetical protein
VGGPGRIRPTGFAFSFIFNAHRHTADKWADRAGSALPVSLFLSPFIRTAMRRISGRAGPDPPYRFRFFFHLSFAPPYGGSVGGPGRIRPTGFAFSFTFHSHRHTADKWADRRSRPTILPPVGLGRRAPPTCRLSVRRREKVNASRFGFRFFFHLSFAPPYGGQVGGPGRIRPTGFAFSFTFHSHRHAADQWARPAVTPYHFTPGRAGPPRPAHLSPERETQRESECFALSLSLFLSSFIRTAIRRISGRTGPDPPYRFRFFFHLSFAPPCGGQVGGPGRIRPTGFAFSFTFHSHRHAADQWARPAVTPYRPRSVFLFSPTPTTPKQYRWHR